MKPELKDWIEWKELCARKLCNSDTQSRLGSFAQSRFGIQLRRQITATNLKKNDALRQLPSGDDAWHKFESYAALNQTRKGKRYKDWIFARIDNASDSPLNIIQSGATLIMRSVVRTHLRVEYSSQKMVSINQPLGDSDLTMLDLLPGSADPADTVVANEYNLLAEKHADTIFEGLSFRERIGLLAKFSGISLNNAEVLAAADCSNSALNRNVRGMFARLRDMLEREYRDDGHDSIMALAILMIQILEKKINTWKKREKRLPDCFYNSSREQGKTES